MRLESGRVFGLDLMRATAILLVLLSHAALFFASGRSFPVTALLYGYFGVELFFVLSGFLIGGILLRALEEGTSPATLTNFWTRRWLRTVPNYLLFLLINVAIAAWLGGLRPSLIPYLFFCQNIVTRPQPFFTESWSLAVEEWFYLLVPIFFVVMRKIWPRSSCASSLVVICGTIIAVTLARSVYVFSTHPAWLTDVRMIVVFRLDACMFGVLAAWVKHYYPGRWQLRAPFFLSVGLLLLATVAILPFLLPGDSFFLHTTGFTLTSLGALLLLPMLDQWSHADGFGAAAIVRISIWSYSLYLVNLPVRAVLDHFFAQRSPFLVVPAFLIISVSFAALIYRLYEKPILALRERSSIRQIDLGLIPASPAIVKS